MNSPQPAPISCWSAIYIWADPADAAAALAEAAEALKQGFAEAARRRPLRGWFREVE